MKKRLMSVLMIAIMLVTLALTTMPGLAVGDAAYDIATDSYIYDSKMGGDGTDSLTIKFPDWVGGATDHAISVWQVLDYDSGTSAWAYAPNFTTLGTYLNTNYFNGTGTRPPAFTLDPTVDDILNYLNAVDSYSYIAKEFKTAVNDYIVDIIATKNILIGKVNYEVGHPGTPAITFTNMKPGYYFFGVDNALAETTLVRVEGDTVVNYKADKVAIDLRVNGEKWTTAMGGEVMTYTIETYVPAVFQEFPVYYIEALLNNNLDTRLLKNMKMEIEYTNDLGQTQMHELVRGTDYFLYDSTYNDSNSVDRSKNIDSTSTAPWPTTYNHGYTFAVEIPDINIWANQTLVSDSSYYTRPGAKIVVTYESDIKDPGAYSTPLNDRQNRTSAWVKQLSATDATRQNIEAASIISAASNPNPKSYAAAYTFFFNLIKVDEADQAIGGAKFALYRDSSMPTLPNDIDNTVNGKRYLRGVSSAILWSSSLQIGSELSVSVPTQADGTMKFGNLSEGIYWLEEVVAPPQYRRMKNPVKIEIIPNLNPSNPVGTYDGTTPTLTPNNPFTLKVNDVVLDTADQTFEYKGNNVYEIKIKNMPGVDLPETGGIGTVLFTVIGSAMILAVVVVLVAKRRKAAYDADVDEIDE